MGKLISKIILSVIFLVQISVFSQGYNIQYDVTYRPKSSSDSLVTEKYVLTVNSEQRKSLFRFQSAAHNDFNSNIYKDFSANIFSKYESILYKFYRTEYQFSPEWKLLDDVKVILGYSCKKASILFGGREWVAWYSPEIPFQDGPYKFSGLPGLILEASLTDRDYIFTAVGIEKSAGSVLPIQAIALENNKKEREFKEQVIHEPAIQYKQDLLQSGLQVTASFNGKKSTDKEIIESINSTFKKWMSSHDNPIEKGMLWIK